MAWLTAMSIKRLPLASAPWERTVQVGVVQMLTVDWLAACGWNKKKQTKQNKTVLTILIVEVDYHRHQQDPGNWKGIDRERTSMFPCCWSIYLSVQPVYLSVYLLIFLSVYLFVCRTFCLSVGLSVYLTLRLSVSVYLLSVCLSDYLGESKKYISTLRSVLYACAQSFKNDVTILFGT